MEGLKQEEIDAAKRLMDAVNLHVQANMASGRDTPGYVAIRLGDGRSPDGILYDNRRDATRHNRWTRDIAFIRVGKDTMPFKEAVIVLQMHRRAYVNGVVFTEEEIVVPQMTELMQPFIPRTLEGLN